jgi:hypothetical protein
MAAKMGASILVLFATIEAALAEVKLVGGSGRHEGNILVGGLPVCDDEHNALNAKVVCRMLGYPYGRATVKSHFGRVSSTFKMDDVRCTGNEASLLDCRHNTVDDCGPDEGAGVICSYRGGQMVLQRKQVGNPVGYFDKTFAEYKTGFESRGEGFLGLEKLHQLTSEASYSLWFGVKDWDGKIHLAVWDQFQVGPGDDYRLTMRGFNDAKSTPQRTRYSENLTRIFKLSFNQMRFSTRDRDQDDMFGEGWNSGDMWSEVEMAILPN